MFLPGYTGFLANLQVHKEVKVKSSSPYFNCYFCIFFLDHRGVSEESTVEFLQPVGE